MIWSVFILSVIIHCLISIKFHSELQGEEI